MKKFILVLLLIFSLPVKAEEFIVSPGESIQNAINFSANGDVIVLEAGVFKESFSFNGKAITIRGSGKETILVGTKFRPAITIDENEGPNSIVENLTLTRGLRAGAITINQAAPIIRQCWFYNNQSIGAGSAIQVFGKNTNNESAIISNNVFYKNKTRSARPGNIAHTIFVNDSSPTINNNTFIANDRSGVYIKGLSAPLVTSNIFSYLGPIKAPERKEANNSGEIEKRGRAIYIENLQSGSNVQVSYNISFGNKIGDVYIQGNDFSFTSLQENPVNFVSLSNNLSTNPLFTGLTLNKNSSSVKRLNDVNLLNSSPAINAGNPDQRFNDVDSSRNDIGATGGLTPFNFTNLQAL
jgi:hypothetical protein